MNKYSSLLMLMITLFLSSTASAQNLVFDIQKVDSKGDYTSIALDSFDNPHISYIAAYKYLNYARWNGSAWTIETVDSAGDCTSIALDSSNNPHISYIDDANSDLKYARWNGSGWIIETVDSDGVGRYSSIALDSSDNPHISYLDYADSDLKYARWNGIAWIIETVDSVGSVGFYPSIALDSSDNPHISYYDVTNRDLKYARWNGSAWIIEAVDSGGEAGKYTSIALDSSDNPHISYIIGIQDNSVKYATWTGNAWSMQIIDTKIDYWHTSIALDSSGNPHISYFDFNKRALKYAKLNESFWNIQMVDSGGSVGSGTSFALDSSGNPHISYLSGKYAFSSGVLAGPTPIPAPPPKSDSIVLIMPILLVLLWIKRKMLVSFIRKLKGIILNPVTTFEALREEKVSGAVKYYVGLAMIFSVIFTLWISQKIEPKVEYLTWEFFFFSIAFLFLWIHWVILILIVVTIIHIGFSIFGDKTEMTSTIKAIVYSLTPISLFGWASYYFIVMNITNEPDLLLNWKPILGIAAWIWSTVLLIIGFEHLHRITKTKAIVAGILGMILLISISFYMANAFLRALPYM